MQCGFVQSFGYTECGRCCEVWQFEVVLASGVVVVVVV